jgi:hypothetical protein
MAFDFFFMHSIMKPSPDTSAPRSAKMKTLASLIAVLTLASCSSNNEPIQIDDPMGEIWKAWAAEIAALNRPGTPKESWDSKTTPYYTKEIKSVHEVESILNRFDDLTLTEKAYYIKLYRSSSMTVKYGFEGDFSALVFFDDQTETIDAFLSS